MGRNLPFLLALLILLTFQDGTVCSFSVSRYVTKSSRIPKRQIHVRVASSALPPSDPSSATPKTTVSTALPNESKTSKRLFLVWIHLVSIFVAGNYFRTTLWPIQLLKVHPPVWALIHGLSAMAFAGGVLTTTLLEWNLTSILETSRNQDLSNNILRWLWQIESKMVLPGVTGSMISGVVQAHQTYGTLRHAPIHVKSALHIMLLFGGWWAWADRRSQADVREGGFDTAKVNRRRFSNAVSCGFLLALYSIMILKPGYI